MRFLTALAASAVLMATAGTASAAIVWASGFNDVIAGENGAGDPDAIAGRTDPNKALGTPDGTSNPLDGFYSPGIGGSIDFTFGGKMFGGRNTVVVYELTIGRVSAHVETADVYVINTILNTIDFVGSIINSASQMGNQLTYLGGAFDEIRIVDTSLLGNRYSDSNDTGVAQGRGGSFDGFDIDALGVAPIPLPAAGLLLVGGLAGLGAIRRRKS